MVKVNFHRKSTVTCSHLFLHSCIEKEVLFVQEFELTISNVLHSGVVDVSGRLEQSNAILNDCNCITSAAHRSIVISSQVLRFALCTLPSVSQGSNTYIQTKFLTNS